MLVGLGNEMGERVTADMESLVNDVERDVALMRAPADWHVTEARRVLVPIGGRGGEHELRARLLGALHRGAPRELRFLTVIRTSATAADEDEALRTARRLADVNLPVTPTVDVVRSDDPGAAILEAAASADLLVLGLQTQKGRKVFSPVTLRLVRQAPSAVIVLARK